MSFTKTPDDKGIGRHQEQFMNIGSAYIKEIIRLHRLHVKTLRHCDRAKGALHWTCPMHAQTTTPKNTYEVDTTRRTHETGKTKEDMRQMFHEDLNAGVP